jgi:CelD/BcsL family acetyltransferase involved in cellulose biosynthesis
MIERIATTAGFEKLRDEWEELLRTSASNCVFLTWEWLFAWWKHLAEGRELFILTVRDADGLCAIAPFALSRPSLGRLSPFRSLEFLGTGEVGSDYLDLIVKAGKEQDVWRELAGYLADYRRTLKLDHLKIDGSLIGDFSRSLKQHRWQRSLRKSDRSPYIDLAGHSWESYLATLGSEHRYNFKRRLKNLEKRFEVGFTEARNEEERRYAFSLLVALHQKRWEQTGARGAFGVRNLFSFHQQMTRAALQRDWLRLYLLWLDKTAVAAIYGFRYRDVFYFYQSGFDPDYRKWSVGLVIMGLAIKSALEEGVREYDLLYGTEGYKFLWTRQSRDVGTMALYPPDTIGRLQQTMQQTTAWLRTGKKLAREAFLQPASGIK